MALTPTEEAQTRTLLAQQAQILSLASEEPAILSSLGATDVNLSQLPAAGSVADADILLLRQGSTDKSVAGSALKAYAKPADATETVSGVVELATDAETNTGTDSFRAITPAKLKLGFTVSLATNGYIKFPLWLGGLIVQWGTVSLVTTTNTAYSLPITYPNAHLAIVGSDSDSVAAGTCAFQAFSTSQLKAISNGDFKASYISIGY